MPTYLARPAVGRIPAELLVRWRRIPSAVAADQLGGHGHADPAIRPIRELGHGVRMTGAAVTAWCEP
jgi:4-hydroxy-4-methyl-2-oxoglutarate aldolase